MSVQDDRISSFVQLKKFHNHEEALQLLKKLASHVKPIMKKRNWRVTILQEFYPNDQRLLGLNIDRGKKICIRLRPHYDQTRFFDFNDLIGTMLHELSHIECAPHDAKFYKLLDLLHDEYDELLVKNHTGDWFFGNHYRLGQGNNVPLASAGLKSLETIEKKQKLERIMPKGGIRLGGTAHTNYNLPIRELTAMAIEQRLKDMVWCGGERFQNEIIINSSSSSNGITTTTTTITTNNFNDNNRSRAVRIPADKLPKVTTTKTNSETEKWSCPQCTFVNRPLVLQCEICLEERPNYGENILESDGVIIIIDQEDNNNIDNNSFRKWGCPRCTFDNDLDNVMCIGCDYLRN